MTTVIDPVDIANILAQELLYQQLVALDGLHSGVPTRTTPTLTPTTLRCIEQTFLELQSHSREAGFVPPLVEPSQPTPAQTQNINTQQHQHHHQQQQQHHHHLQHLGPLLDNQIGRPLQQLQQHHQQQQQHQQLLQQQQQQQLLLQQQEEEEEEEQYNNQLSSSSESPEQQTQGRRNMGGRRPTRTLGISPEEEERRQVRRERNKMAAARCRKRRMDHTNQLLEETDGLEMKKQNLQSEISELQREKQELQFLLDSHKSQCRLRSSSPPDIKPLIKQAIDDELFIEPVKRNNNSNNNNNTIIQTRPNRPNTFPVGFDNNNRPSSLSIYMNDTKERNDNNYKQNIDNNNISYIKTANEVAGIPISTPSSGMPFNFESMMDGGTGLTPISSAPIIPSCSTQQRHNMVSAVDLTSPDVNPPKLVSL
ncbi:transcription factor kayak-like isoform X2 [Aphidius gifuensis]|uniref:transcription factor kayak-like isoform X2 n=1 Tax=Aphidius gifuensis TaxID=684658 RepID=UPI001CDC4775|nr:transcription factor kayak-like isoform X2 [Aphidius gifuensis]